MKLLFISTLALLSATASLQASSPSPQPTEPACGFADERSMTLMIVFTFAAEYYLAYHRWPQSRADLKAQAIRLNAEREADKFFARFSRLDLHQQGRNLRLDVRFNTSGQIHTQSIVLHPGKSADAILQAASEARAT